MILNSLENFPEELQTLLNHVSGPAVFSKTLASVFDSTLHHVNELFKTSKNNPNVSFHWETAAVIANELLQTVRNQKPPFANALKSAFHEKSKGDIEKIEKLLRENFQRLAKQFDGMKPYSDRIQQLRERYDPAVLDANGQSYKGLVSEHESIKGRPPVIQDPKAPGIR